jgi:hypothetical protein
MLRRSYLKLKSEFYAALHLSKAKFGLKAQLSPLPADN